MMNLTGYFYYKNFTRTIRSNNKAGNYSTGDFFDNAPKDNKKHNKSVIALRPCNQSRAEKFMCVYFELKQMVRKERLELSRLAALEPKSSASTNSATLAGSHKKIFLCFIRELTPTKARII